MLTGLKVITLSFPINFKYMAVLNLDKKKIHIIFWYLHFEVSQLLLTS